MVVLELYVTKLSRYHKKKQKKKQASEHSGLFWGVLRPPQDCSPAPMWDFSNSRGPFPVLCSTAWVKPQNTSNQEWKVGRDIFESFTTHMHTGIPNFLIYLGLLKIFLASLYLTAEKLKCKYLHFAEINILPCYSNKLFRFCSPNDVTRQTNYKKKRYTVA